MGLGPLVVALLEGYAAEAGHRQREKKVVFELTRDPCALLQRGACCRAIFSEPMKAASIGTAFKLYRVNSNGTTTPITDVKVTLSSDGLKATLNPFGKSSTLLAKNTKYKAIVNTGARDLAGNRLAANKTWYFTVKP